MTIKNLYPKARPHIIYNVINGRPELPAASTFSRASTGTYVDRAGIIRTAAVDEPRFNYDPYTGEFLGLLLEGEGKNAVRYSNTAGLAPPSSGISNASGWLYTFEPNSPSGDQYLRMEKFQAFTTQAWVLAISYSSLNLPQNTECILSFWVRSPNLTQFRITNPDVDGVIVDVTPEWRRVYAGFRYGAQGMTVPFVRLDRGSELPIGSVIDICNVQAEILPSGSDWTNVRPDDASSYFANSGGTGTFSLRAADAFSLTSSSNFDNGFSFLLDSNTTTDDFIYKIKAGGSTIAELNNDNGTLDWVIDGTSAATSDPPQYPQIGAIQPGRVRTVSSFGAAGDGDQTNYLYTESLSFPTVAEPAAGADELEFGTGQTVKAVYVWDGQLSNTEAVSVIKGEYNVILNEPIQADTYSFVYNTDPTNVGEASITLPYIVPTVSMRVYWGDTTSDRYEPGVTPSHTYPYPGQYRIQIEADDGFDAVRPSSVAQTIVNIDQWAPQHRVGAAGDGFAGSDLDDMFYQQGALRNIPPFKYTDLISLRNFVSSTGDLIENGWNWVPTSLTEATSISGSYNYVGGSDAQERDTFPQMITSNKLTIFQNVFVNASITGFVDSNGNPTNRPITNGTSITNYSGAFLNCDLTDISLDMQSCTNLSATFRGNSFVQFPSLDTSQVTTLNEAWRSNGFLTSFPQLVTSQCTDFTSAWMYCSSLTSFPQIDTSSGTTLNRTWYACNNLQGTFPSINTSSVTNFTWTWRFCGNLTGFPLIDTSSATTLQRTWESCTSLAGTFPLIVSSSVTDFSYAWNTCSSLTGFQQIDTSSGTNFHSSWRSCGGLTAFPAIDTSSGTTFNECWQSCTGLTTFPPLNMSSGTNFFRTWRICTGLTSFPPIDVSSGTNFSSAWEGASSLNAFPANMFDTTGTLIATAFSNAWFNCALTAQSIENILVSLDTNGASNITLSIDGGTNAGQSTWTAAANTAYTNLINKGWAITARP